MTTPVIQEALDKGEDATGLCTLRALVKMMREQSLCLNADDNEICELSWVEDGDRIYVDVIITHVEPA